jgi:hypothetical protein
MDDVEKTFSEVTYGHDEPEMMIGNGEVMKYMAGKYGEKLTHDSNGNEIVDTQVYILTVKGIFPYG